MQKYNLHDFEAGGRVPGPRDVDSLEVGEGIYRFFSRSPMKKKAQHCYTLGNPVK
jgi:hypothetical protein